MSARDTDRLVAANQSESGYQSIDTSTQQHVSDRNTNHDKRCMICTIFLTVILVLLLSATIGCTAYFHDKNAACYVYSAIPQVGVYTRSDAYSLLYSTSTLSCFNKPISIETTLDNEAASVEIYKAYCESIEKIYFQESYNNTVNLSVGQPAPVFSEDFLPQNYFINGSIQVDMVSIITTLPSVDVELCLFTNNDEFQAFVIAGANWKSFIRNAKCHSVRVKTGDRNSTTFHISEPMFSFMGIATTGNLSIGNLVVAAGGLGLSGPGESSTKVCQLNGKNPVCNFSLINNEREDICLVAHEENNSDGSYDYSNLTIKLQTGVNVQFWVSLSVLLFHIAVCITLSFSIVVQIYKRWKQDQLIITPEQEQNTSDHSIPTMTTPAIYMATAVHGAQTSVEHIYIN